MDGPDRLRVLEENHCSVTAGHLGIKKTHKRVTEKYFWPGMLEDVKRFVSSCHDCLRHKSPQQKSGGLMHTKQTHTPWEIITADFVGPLPKWDEQLPEIQFALAVQESTGVLSGENEFRKGS